MLESLIYDWNKIGAPAKPPRVMLDDETLRDGLQSPSVRTPTIASKIEILHLIDKLGIDTADIGLPGAGPHVVADVERLAREIVESKLSVHANCPRRRSPTSCDCEIGQRYRASDEWASSAVAYPHYTDAGLSSVGSPPKTDPFAVYKASSNVVTEDTTRADRRRCSASTNARQCRLAPLFIADTVGHATPLGSSAVCDGAQVIKAAAPT